MPALPTNSGIRQSSLLGLMNPGMAGGTSLRTNPAGQPGGYTQFSNVNMGDPSKTRLMNLGGNDRVMNLAGNDRVMNLAGNNNATSQRRFNSKAEEDAYKAKQALAQSKKAQDEAKRKTEASKQSALGYFDGITNDGLDSQIDSSTSRQLGMYNPLLQEAGQMGDIISPEQQARLMATRKGELAATGQNLTSAFGDSDSGIQTGRRIGIGMDIATRAANMPIETELEIASRNRDARMASLGLRSDITGRMAGVESNALNKKFDIQQLKLQIASGKAGIEQNYQYDPGLDYQQQLGQAMGQDSQMNTMLGSLSLSGPSTASGIKQRDQQIKEWTAAMQKKNPNYKPNTQNQGYVQPSTSGIRKDPLIKTSPSASRLENIGTLRR